MFMFDKRRLHLDFETASDVDLRKTGTYKYARDPSTRILMLGWAFDDDPVNLWEPHKGPMPGPLKEGIKNPHVKKHAFNAAFERLITKHCLGIEVPPEQWRCTMIESYYLSFTGTLDSVLNAIGLQSKDNQGKRLINLFSSPAPKNHKARWYNWDNRPEDWDRFCQYCKQDVNVERQLWHWLQRFPKMPDWDYEQWFTDQRINDRGVPMDIHMAESAIRLWDQEKEKISQKLEDLTGLPKVTRDPLILWINENLNIKLENTQQEYLTSLLSKGNLSELGHTLIHLWIQKQSKAASKYTSIINGTCADGRARGMFQYKGASRTDRVSGRLIQLQNLKKPLHGDTPESINNVVTAIKSQNPELLKLLFPESISEILGGSVRHALLSGEDNAFAVCDFTSIESVVLGWLAQCPLIDATFREGKDSYRVFASNYYNIPYAEVTKDQRTFCKPPVLGCGFMLGWRGLVSYAEGYNINMSTEQAKVAVDTFRNMYPEIPLFWKWINDTVKYVTTTGYSHQGYRLLVERDSEFLRIKLPSGRSLSYYMPEIQKQKAPWSTTEDSQYIDNFTYMGLKPGYQWSRISAHAGGITENIVQSIAGDLLWNGIMNAVKRKLQVVLHVHDEIAVETPMEDAEHTLYLLKQSMLQHPPWCENLWLGVEGYITQRYTKT